MQLFPGISRESWLLAGLEDFERNSGEGFVRSLKTQSQLDYVWHSGNASPVHGYIDCAVLAAIDADLRRRVPTHSDYRVIDVGCGNGTLLGQLRCLGATVAGCEPSPDGVKFARASLGEDVRVECLSGYDDLSAAFGGGWDVVVSTEVIEHLYDPRLFVRRVRDVLRPDGLLILTTPYHGYLKNLALAITNSWDIHLTPLWDGGHIKFWSYRTLCALLAEFGFSDFQFQGCGRLPWLWKSMLVTCRLTGLEPKAA